MQTNTDNKAHVRDRYRGAVLGLAACDALGTTLEFRSPGSFEPLTTITGGGPFHLEAGQWTDDTSMALCLAESLIERQGFDPQDQMDRYVQWWREGHWSSTGTSFDIGNTVEAALHSFIASGEPYSGPTDELSAGNGCIMRLAPVPLAYASDPQRAIQLSGESARTTHGTRACVDACRYMGGLLVGAVMGCDKELLLSAGYAPTESPWTAGSLHPAIEEAAFGSYKQKEPPDIAGTGYVVRCLEAALWAFHRSASFREGALLAVNLGDDADTTGAVYGQIAGAHYGMADIPAEWLHCLAMRNEIVEIADRLCRMAEKGTG